MTYGTATGISILIVVSFLFLMAWLRAFKRKVDSIAGETYMYVFSMKIDQYFFLCMVMYVVTCLWTLGLNILFDSDTLLLTGFFVPAILFFYLNIVQIYVRNNYFFVEDVDGINREVDARNKRVEELKVKARVLREKIRTEGPGSVYGEENALTVKKVMDIEHAKREAAILEKRAAARVQPEEDEVQNRI